MMLASVVSWAGLATRMTRRPEVLRVPAKTPEPGPFSAREVLAGDGGFIDGGGAFDDGAVGGDIFAGFDEDAVADFEFLEFDEALRAVGVQDDGFLGEEFHEGFEGGVGALHGVFPSAGEGEEEEENGAFHFLVHNDGEDGAEDHEEVDVELALAEGLPGLGGAEDEAESEGDVDHNVVEDGLAGVVDGPGDNAGGEEQHAGDDGAEHLAVAGEPRGSCGGGDSWRGAEGAGPGKSWCSAWTSSRSRA